MIVVYAHPKGGVGKSTVCFNYCIQKLYENKDKDFIVIDLDGQHTMEMLNKIRVQNGLTGLNIKTFGNNGDISNKKDKVEDLIKFLVDNQDKDIVIDTGGYDSEFNRIAVAYSDVIIIPTSDSPVEQGRIYNYSFILKDIENSLNSKLNCYILLNRVNHKYSNKTIATIKNSFNYEPYKFLDTAIRDRVDYKFSVANGSNVIESNNDIKAMQEIVSLYEEIQNIL